MQTQKKKTNIRYDDTFKEGAIKMVTISNQTFNEKIQAV